MLLNDLRLICLLAMVILNQSLNAHFLLTKDGYYYHYLGKILFALVLAESMRLLIKEKYYQVLGVLITVILTLCLKQAFDIWDIKKIISFSISSTTGILFFFLLAVAIFSVCRCRGKERTKLASYGLLLLLVLNLLLEIKWFFELLSIVDEEHFLIKSEIRDYQIAANLLIIKAFVLIFAVFQIAFYDFQSFFERLLGWASFLVLAFDLILMIIISQIIGSNLGFVILVGTLISYCISVCNFKIRYIQRLIRLSSIAFSITLSGLLFLSIFPSTQLALFASKFRIFGYGNGVFANLTSRIDLIAYFDEQMNYNLFFGSFLSDDNTIGAGLYPHSFLLSLLTHYGLFIGGCLLCGLTFVSIKLVKELQNHVNNSRTPYFLFDMLIFCGVISMVGTFFAWTPLFFILTLSVVVINRV